MTAFVRASVIIPAYNAAASIGKAIESAQAQTERAIEIIVVDDASSDATADVAAPYAARDSRVRCLRLPQNGGKPAAMNMATVAARGKWIALLDADDWYAPARLKTLIDAAEKADVAMVADNQIFYDAGAERAAREAFPRRGPKSIKLDDFLKNSSPLTSFDYGTLKPVFQTAFIRQHNIQYEVSAKKRA